MDLGERKSLSSASDFQNTHVEPLSEERTKLADFFSSLLTANGLFGRSELAFDDGADHGQLRRRGGFKP
jgi:hypothetical protein